MVCKMEEIEDLKEQIINIGIKLVHRELTHGTCGNISCKIPGQDEILITPSGIPYEKIKPADILRVNFDGKVKEGKKKPSVETPLHLSIYKKRDDVGAIIHTHSTYTLAVSSSINSIPIFLDEIFSHIGGELSVAEYAVPGSEELAKNVVNSLKHKNAVLLSNHGAVCCGKNLEIAFETAESVEKICKIFILSSILGEIKTLPEKGIEYQMEMFKMKKE
ncbi:MAG: class II aldolase/adducin family protein [Thermoplasmata archaeon]|nr:MAG: class II aldolase/adducin family protein [Thermoplasmata archaeon]